MATLEEALSTAEPLERVDWLVYSANSYERQLDRRARESDAPRLSAEEAQDRDYSSVPSALRRQADLELHREVNRRAVDDAGALGWLQRSRLRRNAARADSELDKSADNFAREAGAAALSAAMALPAPERPRGAAPDPSVVQRAEQLVHLRRTEYLTGASQATIAANTAHADLNLHLNKLARREVLTNERIQNERTEPLPPGITAPGLGTIRPRLASHPRSGSLGTSTTPTGVNDPQQRGHGIEPGQGQL